MITFYYRKDYILMTNKVTMNIAAIEINPEFMSRFESASEEDGTNPNTIARYREVVDRLPTIEVWLNPTDNRTYLVSGRHRLEANRLEGYQEVEVIYIEGDHDDAFVQSRIGNIAHGLPYTRKEWQQAMRDIVKTRYKRANAWIAREARCSQGTVAKIRAELEKAGEIPWIEFLEAENSQQIRRQPQEEPEPEAAAVVPPSPAAEIETEVEEEKDTAEGGIAKRGAPIGANTGALGRQDEGSTEYNELGYGNGHKNGSARVTLKLAQVGEALPVEAGLWIDGQLQPVSVTVLIADGPTKGLVETAPGYDNCMIISKALAAQFHLLFE